MSAEPGPSPTRTVEADGGFYEEVEHTADLALRCGGPDLPSLFRSAARGMYRLMGTSAGARSGGQAHTVSLRAPDIEGLLVDWLGELAYLAEARGWIFGHIAFPALTATRLEAELSGGQAARIATAIKAVTYHGLAVIETDEGFSATVVFDV